MVKIQLAVWIIGIICLKNEGTVARKFVLQNEMSEYCRRRVVSSVFLGRQVAESSAEVMHFSRLDLPYSCSISVRTESGSNIILVILSKSEASIVQSCSEGHDQLLVYEMGETFGGYWGALPQSVFQQEATNLSTYYTLKTTEHVVETIEIETEQNIQPLKGQVLSPTTPEDSTEDNYVVMEVPLVNVSGNLELGETDVSHGDEEELFDLIYDVTPRNGALYETSLMPLVQFSIWKQNGEKQGIETVEPRYQLDYSIQGFTPDYRLVFQTNHRKRKFSNHPFHSTKRIKFKNKKKELFAVNNWNSRIYSNSEYFTKLISTPTSNDEKLLNFSTLTNHNDTWKLIERYLEFVNANNNTTATEDMDAEALLSLKKISNMKHNASVYLQPNLSRYKDYEAEKVKTKETINKYSTRKVLNSIPFSVNDSLDNLGATLNSSLINMSTGNLPKEISSDNIVSANIKKSQGSTTPLILSSKFNVHENLSVQSSTKPYAQRHNLKEAISDKKSVYRKSDSGSLVDHESWENIVQVAPVMADLLNVTTSFIQDTTMISEKVIEPTPSVKLDNNNKIMRRKRFIQALSIAHDRPKQIIVNKYARSINRNKHELDSHHLAEVVELQDDEIQGRVALHYYQGYAGPTIFNMCDYSEAKVRQVYLFNSSRIIIAISNFTMDRITVVVTESRVARATGCPEAHLECQVSGVRVCVHKMNACDGLPNCGAYDIYDEDRLLCGSTVGLHYTICLAACTLLAVLLTLLYSVHYWLKRCVPKVSQAFFVYSDKSENILFLDSIMRSPTDYDGGSRMVYHSGFFDDDYLSTDSTKDDDGKVLTIFKRFLKCLICKKLKRHSTDDKNLNDVPCRVFAEPKRNFSFTEAELRKICAITKNASVQTGNSLETYPLKFKQKPGDHDISVTHNKRPSNESSTSDEEKIYLEQSERELLTLRQIRGASTLHSNSKNYLSKKSDETAKEYSVPVEEEIELRSTVYDRTGKRPGLDRQVLERKEYEIHSPPRDQPRTTKHLRFEEEATTIEPLAFDQYGNEHVIEKRRRIFLNTNRQANMDLDTIEEDEEAASSTSRDFKRFWGKGKKNKKKAHLSLR